MLQVVDEWLQKARIRIAAYHPSQVFFPSVKSIHQILNMDESGVQLNPSFRTTVTATADKAARVKNVGGNKRDQYTGIFYAYADGCKGIPLLLFDKKRKPEPVDSRCKVLWGENSRWQTGDTMMLFLLAFSVF